MLIILVSFLTVPSTPLTPRVFVTQSKATSGSQTCTGALFRWVSPSASNGVIDQYIVTFYHTGSENLTKMVLSSTARHFSYGECLQQNYTYSFQVRELVILEDHLYMYSFIRRQRTLTHKYVLMK